MLKSIFSLPIHSHRGMETQSRCRNFLLLTTFLFSRFSYFSTITAQPSAINHLPVFIKASSQVAGFVTPSFLLFQFSNSPFSSPGGNVKLNSHEVCAFFSPCKSI
ncbi:hypothetical protein E2P81_ATG01813 [Venturia nashicola]|uniref:Uncharacterized protein n=1 Tax=Venturia nashicola TaxID=86259 RepID=A0A4Z1PBW9_9PEZI|nr:hypothetical protein E6O75_ATG01860 [Venturia nashicola]TLD35510.1 hypothetical protein E2P81_ATG01813 [Venturia nashicola]